LQVDEIIAQLLVAEGFNSLEEIGYVSRDELASIEGFDEDLAEELGSRAREHIERVNSELNDRRIELGVEDAVKEIDGLTPIMLVALGEAKIKTLDDLGDLATDELIGYEDGILREFGIGEAEANAIIMAARAHWFDDEEEPSPTDAEAGEAETAADLPAGETV
jgi:N utilization substance protein A